MPLTSLFPKERKKGILDWFQHRHHISTSGYYEAETFRLLQVNPSYCQPTFKLGPQSLKREPSRYKTSPVTIEIFGYEFVPHTFAI